MWNVLTLEDVESIMELYAELGGTEQAMKDDFAALGLSPDDVDYLETITAYDIDTDTKTDQTAPAPGSSASSS